MRPLFCSAVVVVVAALAGCGDVDAAADADVDDDAAFVERDAAAAVALAGPDDHGGDTAEAVVDATTDRDDIVTPSCETLVLRQECVMGHCIALLKRHC